MKTTISALLVLGLLATTAAVACPVDDALAAAGAIASCVASIPGPDGDDEQIRNIDTGVDVIDQDHPCTT